MTVEPSLLNEETKTEDAVVTDNNIIKEEPSDAAETKTEDYVPLADSDFVFPEGIEPDTEILQELLPLVNELKLPKDQAQKFVDLGNKLLERNTNRQLDTWEETQTKWVDSAKTDKEFGGIKFDENIAVAKLAIKELGTPELNEMMNNTGVGNHPEFVRFAYRVGKLMNEGRIHGTATAPTQRDPAKLLFPDMN